MSIAEKLKAVSENIPKVYEAGQKSAYDEFWDEFQKKGSLTDYRYSFGGRGWTAETFKPKYNMQPTIALSMFHSAYLLSIDLAEHLEKLGVTIDFSKCTDAMAVFNYGAFSRLPELNFTSASTFNNTFRQCTNLKTVDKLILKSNGSQTFSTPFYSCTALENIILEGTIGKDGLSFEWSKKLSKTSIQSIISCLSDETADLTIRFSLDAVNVAFETKEKLGDGAISGEWATLVSSKPNWNILLA